MFTENKDIIGYKDKYVFELFEYDSCSFGRFCIKKFKDTKWETWVEDLMSYTCTHNIPRLLLKVNGRFFSKLHFPKTYISEDNINIDFYADTNGYKSLYKFLLYNNDYVIEYGIAYNTRYLDIIVDNYVHRR